MTPRDLHGRSCASRARGFDVDVGSLASEFARPAGGAATGARAPGRVAVVEERVDRGVDPPFDVDGQHLGRPAESDAAPRTAVLGRAGESGLRDNLELATLSWVHCFHHDRLHLSIGYVTPVGYDGADHAASHEAA